MSTIKSSDEHLTLNADGSSKDIKFQANGVEKASISSSGAFTSTTIDATKLTGALPAISGAALTGVGVAGITSAADATAITIDSNENVGIGVNPSYRFHVKTSVDGDFAALIHNEDVDNGQGLMVKAGADSGEAILSLRNQASSEKFKVLADGRGLSQFTAKVWVKFNGVGTIAIDDSHNVSSLTDHGTGDHTINFSNNMGNTNYCATSGMEAISGSGCYYIDTAVEFAVGSLRIGIKHTNGSYYDKENNMVTIFGD